MVVVVQLLGRVRLCDPMDRSTPGFPVLQHLLEFLTSVESVMPSDHLTLCRPLLLLPAFKNPTNKLYRPLN